jgi:hypothetical protein
MPAPSKQRSLMYEAKQTKSAGREPTPEQEKMLWSKRREAQQRAR